jgi:polyphosphate kinase
VEDEGLKARLLNEILAISMKDNVNSRELQPDGSYIRIHPADGETLIDSQMWMMERARSYA